jgi:hypothetical protein
MGCNYFPKIGKKRTAFQGLVKKLAVFITILKHKGYDTLRNAALFAILNDR